MADPTQRPVVSSKTLNTRYPADLGQKPFDKWICFEARSGRHVLRDSVVGERGTNLDRTLGSVGLYVNPEALTSSIQVAYDTQALGPYVGAAIELMAQTGSNLFDTKFGSLQEAGGATKELFKNASAAAGVAADSLAENFVEIIKADLTRLASNFVGEAAVGVLTGQKVNPKTDVFFDSHQYRTHSYSFMLIPRSLQEARSIDEICSFFQFYSLPMFRRGAVGATNGAGSFMIGFPYEFVISYRDEAGREMQHINKVARSVLSSVSIDHAAGGKTAFIKQGNEFYPVATKLDLTFQEVVLLDRDSAEIKRPTVPQWEDPKK